MSYPPIFSNVSLNKTCPAPIKYETSDSLLHMIERPTIQCLNDCSRIISILSQNDLKEMYIKSISGELF